MLSGALVDMYAKCGALRQVQSLLEKLPSRNVASWTTLIAGYAQNGQGQRALDCFEQMQHEGMLPNEVTYVCTFKACVALGAIDKVSLEKLLSGNVVCWNALIAGCT